MRVSAVPVATVAACTALLAACAGWEGGEGVDENGVVAYVDQRSDGGDDALLEGTLELDSTCLTVVTAADRRRVLPVFQRSRVSWDGSTLTQDGVPWGVGGAIRLGGGYHSLVASTVDFVPARCEYDETFTVAAR